MLKPKKIINFLKWAVFLCLILLLALISSPILPIKKIPKLYSVVSASMEPQIMSGSLAITQNIDPSLLKVGDIIAFTSPSNPKDTILHRINNIKPGDPLRFSTKGDNNNAIDQWDVVSVGVKGKYVYSIPHLGKIIIFVRQPIGFILLLCLPSLFLIIIEIFNIKKNIEQEINHRVRLELQKKSPKSTLIILFLSFTLSTYLIKEIYSLYSSSITISGISLSVTSSFPSQSILSFITSLPKLSSNIRNFDIGASTNYSPAAITLFYSYNLGLWQSYPEIITSSSDVFHFNSPHGDGLYSFVTQAVDINQNTENTVFDLYAHQLIVDTTPPTTNLDQKSIVFPTYNGQNYLKNGSFDNGISNWTTNSIFSQDKIIPDPQNNNVLMLGSTDITIQGTDYIFQDFSLPSSSLANLSFSYRFVSHDIAEFDYFNVDILDESGNSLIENVLKVGNTNSDLDHDTGWQNISRSLSHLSDQPLRLHFSLTDTGDNHSQNSWVYLDDIKISTLDTRIGDTTAINFLATDLASYIDQSPSPFDLKIGENYLSFSSTDYAQNSEILHHQSILVLPLVLNKISFHDLNDSVEIANNSSFSFDLSSYQIESSPGQFINLSGSIGSGSTLVISTPDLDDNHGLVSLKIGDSLIDSVTYLGQNTDDDFWYRASSGLGPWTMSTSSLNAVLSRRNCDLITLSLNQIPSSFGAADTDVINYEISYQDLQINEKITGEIFPHNVEDGLSQRDLLIPNCQGGIQIPLKLTITGNIDHQEITSNTNIFAPPDITLPNIVINELMWMGSSDDKTSDEWLELRNLSNSSVDISGWVIINGGTSGNNLTIPEGKTIPANGFFLISNYSSSDTSSNLAVEADWVTASISLNDDGEEITLKDNHGNIIDQTCEAPWQAGSKSPNKQSMERNDDPLTGWHTCLEEGCRDTIFWDAVSTNYGTPKAPNLSMTDDPTLEISSNPQKTSLSFLVSNISSYKKIDYEITYLSNSLEKGIGDSVDLFGGNVFLRQDLFLGTCSSLGEVCQEDPNISQIHYKIILYSDSKPLILEKDLN